jgi:hypothetical protein
VIGKYDMQKWHCDRQQGPYTVMGVHFLIHSFLHEPRGIHCIMLSHCGGEYNDLYVHWRTSQNLPFASLPLLFGSLHCVCMVKSSYNKDKLFAVITSLII